MVDTWKSEVARGNRAFQKNHLHQAEVHYSQAIKLLETIQWPDSHSAMIATIVSFQNLIDCHFSQKDPSAAQTSCTELMTYLRTISTSGGRGVGLHEFQRACQRLMVDLANTFEMHRANSTPWRNILRDLQSLHSDLMNAANNGCADICESPSQSGCG